MPSLIARIERLEAARPAQDRPPTLTEVIDRLAHLLRELGATGQEPFEVEGIMLLPGTAVMARVRGF